MLISDNHMIGEVVADDFRTASVFQSYGIDFCCKGNRTIREACQQELIDVNILLADLAAVADRQYNGTPDFQSWPMDLLTDYIEKKHHRYVVKMIPVINQYLEKVCQVHGTKHPELLEIADAFRASADALRAHMAKEEQILFPYVRKLADAEMRKEHITLPAFGTVQNPIQMMMQEHDTEGERFKNISALSNNFTPPPDACNTYKVTYASLEEFEEDLHLHIHLENNILFPKAIAMEASMSS